MPKTPDLEGLPDTEGVSPKKFLALDIAIDEWRDAVAKRMKLTKTEVEAGAKVRGLMHRHNVSAYPYTNDADEEKVVVLEGKEKLKIKNAEDAGEPSETDPDADED